MNDSNFPSHEHISAFADGSLPDEERAHVVQGLLSNPECLQIWHAYHVVGDVMRSTELAPLGDDHAFWMRLSKKLADEPQRPALPNGEFKGGDISVSVMSTATSVHSANAPVWLWQLLAGVACSLLVGVIGLGMWTQSTPKDDPQLASAAVGAAAAGPLPAIAPPLAVVDSRNGAMLRDPQLDKLMAAHQQLGGHSALQLPAGFLRNATYEDAAR